MSQLIESNRSWFNIYCRLIGLSSIGIFIFFVPITLNDKQSIPLDHIVNWIRNGLGEGASWYALFMIVAGATYPIFAGTWRSSRTNTVFLALKWCGVIAAIFAITKTGPELLQAPDMLPFLFDKLVIPVGLIVPIGSVFLAFLVSYGLLETVGILLQRLMQPIWRTPGRSAIDAVASFVGSYSIGLLITNRVYVQGYYSAREAAIIATGFSTVSVTFMLIVAKTLNLIEFWNLYFWLTLLITFITTAITARLPPLSRISNESTHREVEVGKQNRIKAAIQQGIKVAEKAPSVRRSIFDNLKDGFVMTISILPSIMSVGVIGLLAAKYTPIFDWIGYLFYPITWLWSIDNSMELARSSAAGLAEMFLPALLMKDADIISRFSAGVVCVSSILFFSASIPCILSTKIPLNVGQLVAIWFIRTSLSLFLAIPVALVIFH